MLRLEAVWFLKSGAWSAELAHLLATRTWPVDVIPRGVYIYLPEEACEYVYVVSVGRLRLLRVDPEGREQTFALLEPDDLFGSWREGPREFVLEVVQDAVVKTVDRSALDREAQRPVRVTLPGGVETALPLACFLDTGPHQRVARLLRHLADELGVTLLDKRLLIPVKMRARDLIRLTGLSEEAARQAIEALVAERVIEITGEGFLIRRHKELERWAEGTR